MREWKQRFKNNRGFTLIEILVVIGIMAVLAAVIIPRIVNTSDASKVQADLANVKLLQSAVERYYFDKGEYPTGADDATGDKIGTGTLNMTKLISGKYITEAPKDPWSTNANAAAAYQLKDGVVQPLKK